MANRIIEQPVALLYRKIHAEGLNGELRIQGSQFTKTLFFRNGKLDFANTTIIQERLGEILYKMGSIDQTRFWSIHKLMEGGKGRLGQLLIAENILNREVLHKALVHQVVTIAASALAISSGSWTFSARIPDLPEDSRFGISLPDVIFSGISKMENHADFRNHFFDWSAHPLPIEDDSLPKLDTKTRNFHSQLQELRDIPCSLLHQRLKVPEETVWKTLTLLYLTNCLDFREISNSSREMDKNVENLLALFNRLQSRSIDHYKLLELKDSAEEEDIKSAYFRLAKQYHPDRISYAPDPEIKNKANFVFAAINKAYDTLINPSRREEYDIHGESEGGDGDRVRGNLKEKARILSQKARTLYNQQKFWESSTLMDEAIRLDSSKSAYFLLLGMAQVHIPSLRRSAEQNLKKAVELDPWNADAFTGLGLLFHEEDLKNRAEGFYKKALSINPDHKIARKRLNLLLEPVKKKRSSLFGRRKK